MAVRMAGAEWAAAWAVGEEVRGDGWRPTVRRPVDVTGMLASVLSNMRRHRGALEGEVASPLSEFQRITLAALLSTDGTAGRTKRESLSEATAVIEGRGDVIWRDESSRGAREVRGRSDAMDEGPPRSHGEVAVAKRATGEAEMAPVFIPTAGRTGLTFTETEKSERF